MMIIQAADLNHYGNDQMNRIYSPEGLAPTLKTVSGGGREVKVLTNGRYRKLTPKEYFRLMGFSDSDYELLATNGISKTQIYKMQETPSWLRFWNTCSSRFTHQVLRALILSRRNLWIYSCSSRPAEGQEAHNLQTAGFYTSARRGAGSNPACCTSAANPPAATVRPPSKGGRPRHWQCLGLF